MDKTILDLVNDEIEKEAKSLADDVVAGINDPLHYHRVVGIIRGLRLASEIFNETYKKIVDE